MNLMISLIWAACSWGAIASPQDVVKDIFSRAGAPEIASDPEKQAAVNALVDFETLARSALGREARTVPPKEFQWFRNTLQEIITRTVYPKAPDFLKGVKISYEAAVERGNRATVSSSVQNKADFTEVQYRMQKGDDGIWRVVDVSISGLSWVESIQDQVRDTVRRRQWKGLKDAMNKRLNELKAGSSG
jgi:ABC-type transporter MlaC component